MSFWMTGGYKPIEATAILDRCFQQKRLLQGDSTENIMAVHSIVQAIKQTRGNGDPDKSGND